MKTALKNNFEKTLSALLFIVMCLYTYQTYAQMMNMTPYDLPIPDSLRLATDKKMTKEQAIYDINALIYTVSEVHPNMYAMCNQGEFMSRVNAIEQEMPDTITRATLCTTISTARRWTHTRVSTLQRHTYKDCSTLSIAGRCGQPEWQNNSSLFSIRHSERGRNNRNKRCFKCCHHCKLTSICVGRAPFLSLNETKGLL